MNRWRRIRRLALALALVAAAIAAAVHAPPVRRIVLRYAVGEVQRRYGIRIEAARLDYNLVELTVGFAQIRVAAVSPAAPPFFQADYVRAALSRRAFMGSIVFNEIAVTGGRVHIVRDRDGRTNLPESAASAGEPAALNITHLIAPKLVVQLQDAENDLALGIPGLDVDLGRTSGRLSLVAPATLSVGTREAHLSVFDGGAAFDGRAMTLSMVQLRTDEGSAQLDGTLSLMVREPSLDLHVTGSADLERLARWGIDTGEAPRGSVAFDAHAAGTLAAPAADVQLSSPRVTWSIAAGQPLLLTDIAATTRVTAASADVQQLRFTFAGGQVSGKALVPLDDSAAHLTASWSGVDAATVTSVLAGAVAVAPTGMLSGDLEAAGPLGNLSQMSATLGVHAAGGTTGRGRVAVPGDARLQLADGRWRLEGHHTIGGVAPIAIVAAGALNDADLSRSTLAGSLSIAETRLPALLRLVSLTGLAATPADLATGTFAARATLGGRVATPTIDADVQLHDVAASRVRADSIEARVSGQPLDSRLAFSIRAPDATIAEQPLGELRAAGRLAGDLVHIDTLSVAQRDGPGTLSATGSYDLRGEQYIITLDAMGWSVIPTSDLPLSGQVDAMLRGAGSVDRPGGAGSLHVTRAAWSGTSVGDLAAEIQLDGQAANVTARAPDFNATLTARTSVNAPYATTADLRADDIDLARVEEFSGGRLSDSAARDGGPVRSAPPAQQPDQVPLTGRATITAHAEGPLETWRDMVARVEVTSLDAKAGDLPIGLAEPARLRYEQQAIHVEALDVNAGATRLSASGDLAAFEPGTNTSGAGNGSGLVITVIGDVGEAARAAAATGLARLPISEGSGPIALQARVRGSLEKPVVTADLDVGPGSVTIKDLSTASDLAIHAHLEGDTLNLRDAHASYEGAMLNATGSVPVSLLTSASTPSTAPASVHATATGVTPAVLRGLLDPTTLEDLTGAVDLTLNVQTPSLDLVGATGDLTLTRLDLRLAGLSVAQRLPTRIVARDGFARIESWHWTGEGATLDVSGQVRLADRQAAILANGDIDLRVLTPFVRSAGLATAGRLTPKLSITGPLDSPRIDGDVALDAGEIRLLDPRVIVNGLTARAVLTRTTAALTMLNGSINGGSLTGGGTIEYQPDAGVSAALSADIRDMALEFPAGLRTELNAMLQLAVASEAGQDTPAGRLSGTVTVLRGSDREPLAVVGGMLISLRARQAAATMASDASPFLSRLALDIGVQTDEDIIVDNNYARVQLGADVDVIGTAAAPGMSGRAELREGGQLFIGRNVYRIKPDAPSTIDFANPTAIDPQLNVQVTTRVGGEDIDVTLTGPAEAPQVSMSSSPGGYGQADITALLLTGRTLDQLSTADASFIGAQVIGNLSGEVLGFAARAVGLDTLRLGGVEGADVTQDPTTVATAVDPTSRLTFGKNLGPKVDVTFSQSLRDSTAQTWIVDYLPLRHVQLRVVSGDTNLRSYFFQHDVSFGGGGTTAARTPRAARGPNARVAEVSVTGELAFPEPRIRGVLKLGPGDTFDFGRWQDDRDRLEDFYHTHDHLAARVTASRATDGSVVKLSYVIEAGPRTSIAISGTNLDDGVIRQLTDAWAASIFDEFLVDEARQIVSGALAQRGYLQPVVNTRVAAGDGMKTLHIDVQPGSRSRDTRIRIDSADKAIAADLDLRIAEGGLVQQVIRDPGAVVRQLTGDLRSRGYLRAKVTAGPPLFENGVAIVPIMVDAGPSFTVGMVVFEGRQSIEAGALAGAAAVMTGMPYDPVAIDVARDRLVALYRRSGLAFATVTPRAVTRPADPIVDVTFAIQEGARQTIGDVVVAGNSGVDADVITRAMQLTVGTPLEPDELLRARTRVFTTGLFRRVDVTTEGMERTAGDPAQPIRVRVTVEAWPALRLRYGFQAAEEHPETNPTGRTLEPGLSADLTRRTLFGRAISLGGAVQYERLQSSQRAILNAPTLLSLPVQSSLVLEREHQESTVSTFVTDTNSISWQQALQRSGHLTLSYAYRFEKNHTFNPLEDAGSGLNFDLRIRIARLIGAAAWDTRNDPLDAARGMLLSSSVQWAPDSLGSQFRFVKYVGQAYRFQTVHGVVFASAARLGLVRALGGQDLFIGERFYAGGARSVRGVDEDSLGPVDIFGDPAGGEAMLILNQEARVPIYKWLSGVAFFDAGNVFPRASDLKLTALTGSIGAGVRLTTPFALLRADYGRVKWPGLASGSGRWTFGIGQAF